jgi:lipopolysaccharide transport system ATP-binding protein
MHRAEIRSKFDEIVAFAEVEKFLDTPVKHYSSGMYVRLAFAVAAHLEPDILVIDEVLAVGDQEFQRKCLGKLESVTKKEGRTVLFVSHNLAAVRHLCNRAILLQNGELVCTGEPCKVISRYINSAAAPSASGNYKHIQGDGLASITQIDIQRADSIESVFAIYDEMRISIHYKCKADLGPLDFFVLIYGDDGECLLSIFQRDSGTRSPSATLNGCVTLSFKTPFAPGRYLVSAGIFDSSRQFLDWVEFGESFQVEAGFADGRNYDNRLGRLSLIPTWILE